jgi:hypothetical protein
MGGEGLVLPGKVLPGFRCPRVHVEDSKFHG